jgi:tetrahydromethanopterin S-methyltransferase subunit G
MMDANELKKQIDCMEKQVDNLDHQLFQMRSELSKRVFGMDTVDIVAMANRMNDLEERIVVGDQKVAMAKRILG